MHRPPDWPRAGLTLVELIIYLTVISICLAGLHAWLTNLSVRKRIAEVLSIADSAKQAIVITCAENPGIPELTSNLVGFPPPNSKYIESISFSSTCEVPIITIATINTGSLADLTFTIIGDKSGQSGKMEWVCTSYGPKAHIPEGCQD